MIPCPCTKDCKRRCCGCVLTCPDIKVYEAARAQEYKERLVKQRGISDAYAIRSTAYNKYKPM